MKLSLVPREGYTTSLPIRLSISLSTLAGVVSFMPSNDATEVLVRIVLGPTLTEASDKGV